MDDDVYGPASHERLIEWCRVHGVGRHRRLMQRLRQRAPPAGGQVCVRRAPKRPTFTRCSALLVDAEDKDVLISWRHAVGVARGLQEQGWTGRLQEHLVPVNSMCDQCRALCIAWRATKGTAPETETGPLFTCSARRYTVPQRPACSTLARRTRQPGPTSCTPSVLPRPGPGIRAGMARAVCDGRKSAGSSWPIRRTGQQLPEHSRCTRTHSPAT
eukprot:7063594-Prymnesium_polylepis.2